MTDISLLDIPDLSNVQDVQFSPLENGWYQGQILEKREFVDRNGNERVFESSDTPAQSTGRNIRLQVEIKRKADGRTFNLDTLVHYKPEYLTQETVAAIAERKAAGGEWGELYPSFMTLQRLGKLQKIAGTRQLQRNSEGGLDLTSLYGKVGFFRVCDNKNNPKYKQIDNFQATEPVKVPVL